jgi:peptide/nickel transport system substrate-binding protein
VADDVASTIGIVQSSAYPGPAEVSALWRDVRVEVVDPATVRFRLPRPYSSFIEACALPILPAHRLGPQDAGALRQNDASYEDLGAGPFKILEHTPDVLRLGRHEAYAGQKPFLEEVDFLLFPDPGTALSAFLDRRVDGLAQSDKTGLPASDEALTALEVPLLGQQIVLFLNQRNPILAERRVRAAIALGLDRSRLLGQLAPGTAVAAFGPIPAYSWAYAPLVEITPNPSAAAQFLDSAGFTGVAPRNQGGRPLQLQLLAPMDRRLVALSEDIRAQLEGLGFRIELQPTDELDLYRERINPRRFDMALLSVGLGSVDPDPYPLWDSQEAQTGFNLASYRRPEADRFLEAARLDGDPARRQLNLESFQRLWIEDVPSVVLASPAITYAVWNRVQGVRLGTVPEAGARFQHIAEWYMRTERLPVFIR